MRSDDGGFAPAAPEPAAAAGAVTAGSDAIKAVAPAALECRAEKRMWILRRLHPHRAGNTITGIVIALFVLDAPVNVEDRVIPPRRISRRTCEIIPIFFVAARPNADIDATTTTERLAH